MPLNCVANTSRRGGSQLLWINLTNKLLHSRAGLAAIILQEAGLDRDFASPPPPSLNSPCVTLQNRWTVNFSKEGPLLVQELCTPHDRNQSINPPTRQWSGTALIRWTSRPKLQPIIAGGEKNKKHLSHPTMLCSSLQLHQTSSSWSKGESDSTAWQALLSAMLREAERRGLSHTQTLVWRMRQQTCFSGILVSKTDRWASRAVA